MKLIITESQLKNICNVFKDTTGNRGYDDILKSDNPTMPFEIIEMSPEEYFERCSKMLKTSLEDQYRVIDQNDIKKFSKKMKEGIKFDLPYIDYNSKHQDGRHRILSAKELGCKKIRVAVFGKNKFGK